MACRHVFPWSLAVVLGTSLGISQAEDAPIQLPAAAVETLKSRPPGGPSDAVKTALEKALKPLLLPLFQELFGADDANPRIMVLPEEACTQIQMLCYAPHDAGSEPPGWASLWLRVNEADSTRAASEYTAWRGRVEASTKPAARLALPSGPAFGDSGFDNDSAFRSYRWFRDSDHLMVFVKAERPGVSAASMAERLDRLLTARGIYDLRRRLVGATAPAPKGPRLVGATLLDANPLFVAGPPIAEATEAGDVLARATTSRVAVAADGVSLVLLRLELSGPGVVKLAVPDDERPFSDGSVTMLFGGKAVPWERDGTKGHAALALYRPPVSFEEPKGRTAESAGTVTVVRPRLRDVVATRSARLTLALGANAGQLSPQPAAFEVPLVRPPVVLVHGTFDDPVECWDRSAHEKPAEPSAGEVSMVTALTREGHAVFLADFHETNGSAHGRPLDSGFDKQARTFWSAPGGAYDALRTFRVGLNVAATQVDVVGHSLGGLIPRLWASKAYNPAGGGAPLFDRTQTTGFERPDNFGAGDIHRLVTIATPHQGSDFADLAIGLEEMPTPLRTTLDRILWRSQDDRPELKWLLERGAIQYLKLGEGYGVSPVVRDQRAFLPDSPNEALAKIGPTPVASHAIVCVAAVPDVTRFEGTYKLPLQVAGWWMVNARPVSLGQFLTRRGQESEVARLYGEAQDAGGRRGARAAGGESWAFDEGFSPAPTQNFTLYAIGRALLFGNTQNDMIVRVQSQTGGLPLEATSLVRGVLHTWAPRYASVQERVVTALGGAFWRFHATGFPSPGPLENVPPVATRQGPAWRSEAVESSNIPPAHCEAISHAAVDNDVFILLRPVNRYAEPLVAAHMATKDMHVKGKSASWGPQRGYIPVEQRFSKLWFGEREKIRSFDAKVEQCLTEGRALETPLTIEVAGAPHEVLVVGGEGLEAPDAVVLRRVGETALFGWRNRDGRDFDPTRELAPSTLSAADVARRGVKPLHVLADRHSRRPLTADFDLLALASRTPCDAPREDPEKGFVCDWQVELIRRINEQVRLRANYIGGNVVHHGPEANFPGSEGADYPVAVFEPSGRIATIEAGPPGSQDLPLKIYFHHLVGFGYSVRPNGSRWGWGAYQPDTYPETGWRPEDHLPLPPGAVGDDEIYDSDQGDEEPAPAGAGAPR